MAYKTELTMQATDGYGLLHPACARSQPGAAVEISLLDQHGETAATWHYKDLLSHWTRKHAEAAYVPPLNGKDPANEYQYGRLVRLAEGTGFLMFVRAVASGVVYYDPGIKIVNVSAPRLVIKKRSQFRIRSASIPLLYGKVEELDVIA